MLGRVLLHVIAAAGRVDFATNRGSGLRVLEGSFQVMDDVPVFGIGGFGDTVFLISRNQPARVVDLAAAGGIERRAVENDRRARGFDHRADLCVKIVEKRIVVIEAVRHAFFSIGIEQTVIKWLRAVIPKPLESSVRCYL